MAVEWTASRYIALTGILQLIILSGFIQFKFVTTIYSNNTSISTNKKIALLNFSANIQFYWLEKLNETWYDISLIICYVFVPVSIV